MPCMKKVFPTDDEMTSSQKLRDAQCNEDHTKRQNVSISTVTNRDEKASVH